jgi:polyisoprenoid-binding protein YceI
MAWVIDPSHTQIEFSVKHMMISTVRGRFGKFSGTVEVDEMNPANSSVQGTVDVASVDTQDAIRDGHLRSPDFFDAAKYPTMSFRSTRIQPAGAGQFKMTGELTIKDVTHQVVFTVSDEGQNKDPWGNQRWGLSAQTTISRKDFGLVWNVALETGGVLVSEQVKINAEVQLIRQA